MSENQESAKQIVEAKSIQKSIDNAKEEDDFLDPQLKYEPQIVIDPASRNPSYLHT